MGLGRIGKTEMRGRCRAQGCNTSWETPAEYLKCEGCEYPGCKIKQSYMERQVKNATIEADKVIERMRNRHRNKQKKEDSSDVGLITEEDFPIESFYEPADGETELEREVPPVMHFTIK